MRQIGFLSACAAYALSNNFALLPAVHALAKKAEAGLKDIGAHILSPAETCMVSHVHLVRSMPHHHHPHHHHADLLRPNTSWPVA